MSGAIHLREPFYEIDEGGRIYALRDDVPAILRGEKTAEPLVIRANAGDVVDITLTSALPDVEEVDHYSKVGIHTHLVQYDVQSSDGAVGGCNYETSIRSALAVAENSQLVPNGNEAIYGEQVRYRWWCDVELGMIYFHDHSLLKTHLPHGLFGATVCEPVGSEYRDPASNAPVYHVDTDGVIRSTTDTRSLAVTSIVSPNDESESFREYVPMFSDGTQGRTTNLREVRMIERLQWAPPLSAERREHRKVQGGRETMFSSRIHGDPTTLLWRSYAGDPIRVRTEGGGTHEIHSLNINGVRWRFEDEFKDSTLRTIGVVGVSEGFSFLFGADPRLEPGDYLYSSPGELSIISSGQWGVLRMSEEGDHPKSSSKATGVVRMYVALSNAPDFVREFGDVLDDTLVVEIQPENGAEFRSITGERYFLRQPLSLEVDPKTTANRFNVNDTETIFVEFPLIAARSGYEGNAPNGMRFGVSPAGIPKWKKTNESGKTRPVELVTIVAMVDFTGGAMPLARLDGNYPEPQSRPLVPLLPPAPEPDIPEGAETHHVAAISATFKPSEEEDGFPILAYMPLNEEQQHRASEIKRDFRDGQKDVNEDIIELRKQLQKEFEKNPEPFVFRIAAPPAKKAKHVAVELTNLLPSESELLDDVNHPIRRLDIKPEDWTSATSLHVCLPEYNVRDSDGSAVGRNDSSLVLRGDSRTYLLTIDREFGSCLFHDEADPVHASMGLFGGMIVEPAGSYENPSKTGHRTRLQVTVQGAKESSSFREFVVFLHSRFGRERKSGAINYQSSDGQAGAAPPLTFLAHAGDPIRLRVFHSAGQSSQDARAFFLEKGRWSFDASGSGSHRIASMTTVPSMSLDVLVEPFSASEGNALFGSHVGIHLGSGQWGELQLVNATDGRIVRLHSAPASAQTGDN
jgi:hypothetical protein